jgi:hypothetical protein
LPLWLICGSIDRTDVRFGGGLKTDLPDSVVCVVLRSGEIIKREKEEESPP